MTLLLKCMWTSSNVNSAHKAHTSSQRYFTFGRYQSCAKMFWLHSILMCSSCKSFARSFRRLITFVTLVLQPMLILNNSIFISCSIFSLPINNPKITSLLRFLHLLTNFTSVDHSTSACSSLAGLLAK